MATPTAVFTQSAYPKGQDMTQRRLILHGPLVIAGSSNYPVGGIPLTFNPTQSVAVPIAVGVSKQVPVTVFFASRGGSGYIYNWTTVDLWTALMKSNVVVAGQSVIDTNGNIQTVTTGGTCGSGAEPTWNQTVGGTTTDNTTVWTNKGVSSGLVQIFQSGAGSGTISAPTITTTTNATTTTPLYVNAGALTETTGASGITGVQAPTFTGTSAGALAELGAVSLPAGVTGDTIASQIEFLKG